MSAGVLEEIIAGHLRGIPRMNVEQFERFMDLRFPEGDVHCELLDGYPVLKDSSATGEDPMIMGARHAIVVDSLNARLVRHVHGSEWRSTCQTPVVLNNFNAVEPDLSVIRRTAGSLADYPGPDAVILIIEVADSSVEADRITKLKKYAAEEIPTYWLVNLREGQIEVFGTPNRHAETYQTGRTYLPDESVDIVIPGLQVLTLSVHDVLNATL